MLDSTIIATKIKTSHRFSLKSVQKKDKVKKLLSKAYIDKGETQ